MMKFFVNVLFLIVLIVTTTSNTFGATKEPLLIGSMLPLTGAYSIDALDMKKGIEIALEEVNDSGGVLGRPLRILFRDTQLEPRIGVAFATKLIDEDKVPLILGDLSSATNYAVGGVTSYKKVVQIAIGATGPQLRKIGPYFFNVTGLADTMGTELAKFALEDSKAETVGLITTSNPWGMEIEGTAKKYITNKGVKVVSSENFKAGQKDFYSEIMKLFHPKPQIVFLIATVLETKLILDQSASIMRFKNKIGWYAPYIDMLKRHVIPEAAEGLKGLSLGVEELEYRRFVDKYNKKFGRKPTTVLAAYAYDATKMAALAINKAGSIRTDKIRDALFQTSESFVGVTGGKKFDGEGMQIRQRYRSLMFEQGELIPSPKVCPRPPWCFTIKY